MMCRCHCVTVSPCSVFFVFWLLTADPRHSLPAATPPLNEASLHKDLKLPALYAGVGEKRNDASFGEVQFSKFSKSGAWSLPSN